MSFDVKPDFNDQKGVIFRGKPFDVEKVEMSTRFSPISIFKIGMSNGRFLKIIYLFGVIPIWRSLYGYIPDTTLN